MHPTNALQRGAVYNGRSHLPIYIYTAYINKVGRVHSHLIPSLAPSVHHSGVPWSELLRLHALGSFVPSKVGPLTPHFIYIEFFGALLFDNQNFFRCFWGFSLKLAI